MQPVLLSAERGELDREDIGKHYLVAACERDPGIADGVYLAHDASHRTVYQTDLDLDHAPDIYREQLSPRALRAGRIEVGQKLGDIDLGRSAAVIALAIIHYIQDLLKGNITLFVVR